MPNVSLWTRVMVEQSQTQTLPALKGITASTYGVGNGVFAFVPGLGLFQYEPSSTATGDDINVVQPTTGTGRWLRVTQAAPTVNAAGQLLSSNIAPGIYEVTVSGDGSADYLTIYDALVAGYRRIAVVGNTIETNSFVFDDSAYYISLYLMSDIKIDCGNVDNLYDASTNGAFVEFTVNGVGNPLSSGFIWSPNTNKTLFNFLSAQPGSRLTLNRAYIDASGASPINYAAFRGGLGVSIFGDYSGFGVSDSDSLFIQADNVYLVNPIIFGGGNSCSSVIYCPTAEICTLVLPVFVNQFSPTAPVVSARFLNIDGAYNASGSSLPLYGLEASINNIKERPGANGFKLTVDGNSFVSNCYLPNGVVKLSSTSTYTAISDSVLGDLDESGNPTEGATNICNVTFTNSQDFGTGEKVVWNLVNVSVLADCQISGRDVSWNGGALGTASNSFNLTINAGATNALVTNLRTNSAITNNEPSAMLGLNPIFS